MSSNWRDLMDRLKTTFPSPWRDASADHDFERTFHEAVALLDRMKAPRTFEGQAAWRGYLGDPALPDYSRCREARLAEHMAPLDEVIRGLVALFDGMPNWNHPQTMANVIPPANTASIIGATLGAVFSPNIVEGEYSWNVAKAEIESGAILADMVGWDPDAAGGLYTFGGSGCYLYAVKLALTHVLGEESRRSGIREDGQILVSAAGHYAKSTTADWSGLGTDNIRSIELDEHHRMSIPHLRRALRQCREEGKPVVLIVCTMGTTDTFAVDPIAEVRDLVDEYENATGHPRPLIYADAVIGWSFTAFNTYDFRRNPLGFSVPALKAIQNNQAQIESVRHADAVGVDFHKTGWSPYCSSFLLVKDYARFTGLLGRPMPAYLQDRTDYNPFKFTLETSRSGSGALAGWATLKLFGREGFQAMLGRLIEMGLSFRALLEQEKNFVCVNPDNHGFVTLFRVYPRHVDARAQYEREIADSSRGVELRAYNQLQTRVANKLFAMLRDPAQRVPGWESPPYCSLTTGFKSASYRLPGHDEDEPIAALKVYPLSPNSNELSMLLVRNYLAKARDLAVEELLAEAERPEDRSEEPASRRAFDWFGARESVPKDLLLPPRRRTAVESLRQIPLCAHFDEARCQALVGDARTVTANAGDIVFREGDKADAVYVLVAGRVKIFKVAADGAEVDIALFSEGSFFGEMALFDGGERLASVRCVEPSEFLVIGGERFLQEILR